MKKWIFPVLCLCASGSMYSVDGFAAGRNAKPFEEPIVMQADSSFLKNLFDKVVDKATTVSEETIYGTWNYKGSACQFETDDLLKKAGGDLAARELVKKLDESLSKIGIKEGISYYTFNEDKTFSTKLGKKELTGTFVYDEETKTLELSFFKLAKMKVFVRRSGKNMDLLFEADKILKVLTAVSSFSNLKTVAAIGKLAEQYDGLRLGYKLEKAE